MSVVTLSSGKRFEASAPTSLLEAAQGAGIALPYSCRTGRCSSCKGRVTAGTTTALSDEPGLTRQELAAGWVLTCVRTPTSDVHVDIEDLGDERLETPRTSPCRIQALESVAADVMKVWLRLPPSTELHYRPGQYVDVIGVGGLRRSYSIANAPQADRLIELHIRAVPDGAMSRYWFEQARVGDLLRLRGPLGTFYLRDHASDDVVFLATGTGIGPVKAMLEGLSAQPIEAGPRTLAVYWGGRSTEDLYWQPRHPRPLHYVPVLSRADASWTGARGYVQQVLLNEIQDLSRLHVYACGSDAMIHGARALLCGAGLPERRFRSDAFVCSAAA